MRTPTASDPLEILCAYDLWATRRLLTFCRGLTDEQWQRRFPIGPGSLHATCVHIIGCMLRWADRIEGRELRPTIEPAHNSANPVRSVAQLETILEEASRDFARAVAFSKRTGLGSLVTMTFEGKPYTFTRAAAILHVLNHGTHHRAQCLNMLRHLEAPGVSDALPDFDVVDWQHETEVLG